MSNGAAPRKQKRPRLRFGHLRGDTAWVRLIAWMRRRRLRAFIIYTAVIALLFGFIGWAIFLSGSAGTNGDFWGEFSTFALLLAVYLIPWAWMLVWIIAPEKHHQARRIKQLGNALHIVEALEEDLSAPDGIVYQRGGVLVTQRYIVYTGFFAFFLYPLEGLVRFDYVAGAPVLHYGNGTSIRVVAYVPFRRIKKHLPEHIEHSPAEKLSKRGMVLIALIAALGIGVFLLLLYASAAGAGNINGKLLYSLFPLCFFAVLTLIIAKNNSKAIKAARMLSAAKDPDEKIRKIEELNRKGFYKNALGQYLNQLSVAYFERGDNEKALELIRGAYGSDNSAKPVIFGRGLTALDAYRMNEVSYLIALGQTGEAERLVNLIDESRLKHPNALYNVVYSRAQIAVRKGDAPAARELLHEAQALPVKLPKEASCNKFWNLLLIEAECELLEHCRDAALPKLNDIAAHCTHMPTVRRAEEIIWVC